MMNQPTYAEREAARINAPRVRFLWLLENVSPSNIRAAYAEFQRGYFFDSETMKFFGDTMKNFGARVNDCGQLVLYRRRPVKHGLAGGWIVDPLTLDLRHSDKV